MTVVTANPANFKVKLATLKSGDTLVLANGSYGALKMSHAHFANDVIIKGGSFSSVTLYDVAGVHLVGTEVKLVPAATSTSNSQAIRITQSQDVTIDHATVSGGLSVNGVLASAKKLDASGNVLGLPIGKGINIDSSHDVVIKDSDISKFMKGITFSDAENLTISNNEIHDLRTTPISGSVHYGLTVLNNHTTGSHPWNYSGTGDHGDRIHIWTDDRVATDVVIANNRLEQGDGDPMLGIYLDDNRLGYGFENVLISHNKLVDGAGQGMRLENTSGTVFDNTLLWSGTGNAKNDTPRIQVTNGSHDIQFISNRANVGLDADVHDLSFLNEVGSFAKSAKLGATAQSTIHIATGNFAEALAAVGLTKTGATLPGGPTDHAAATAFASSHALSFVGHDLAGHSAATIIHPLGVIG